MKNSYRQEVERELREEWELTKDDVDLIRHVMCDDERPPQGLHQGGYGRRRDAEPES